MGPLMLRQRFSTFFYCGPPYSNFLYSVDPLISLWTTKGSMDPRLGTTVLRHNKAVVTTCEVVRLKPVRSYKMVPFVAKVVKSGQVETGQKVANSKNKPTQNVFSIVSTFNTEKNVFVYQKLFKEEILKIECYKSLK